MVEIRIALVNSSGEIIDLETEIQVHMKNGENYDGVLNNIRHEDNEIVVDGIVLDVLEIADVINLN